MALDPRISLAAKPLDIGAAFNNVLTNINQAEQFQRQRKAAPFQQQILEQQAKQALLGQRTQVTGAERLRESLLNTLQDPNASDIEKQSARIALQVEAPVRTSAQERIAVDEELTSQVAQSQAEISGAKEERKLESQLRFKPEITKAVKLAEKAAAERGETLTALNRSKAALPGLTKAVGQLRELAQIGTSTIGGKIFDTAVKQTGFGSTKGATARAKFIAIVNNQVLPLLKETFGAAFTATEGEALKATMGDPDASPEEKMVQLDAFIEQKQRDIETRETQLNQGQQTTIQQQDARGTTTLQETTQPVQQFQEGQTATNPQTGQKIIFQGGQWVAFNG